MFDSSYVTSLDLFGVSKANSGVISTLRMKNIYELQEILNIFTFKLYGMPPQICGQQL